MIPELIERGAEALERWTPTAIAVNTADDYRTAGEYLNRLKAYRKKVTEYWEPEIKAAHRQHQSLIAKRDALLEVTAVDESTVKYQMLSWHNAEERRVRDEQARVDALARQAAADRALADAAALEQHAQESETPALAVMARSMIEDTYIDQEVAATRHVVASAVPKVAGISTPTRLVVECTDKRALVLAIAAHEMLVHIDDDNHTATVILAFLRSFRPVDGLHYLDVNMPAVRREAVNKGDRFAMAGIRAEKQRDIR